MSPVSGKGEDVEMEGEKDFSFGDKGQGENTKYDYSGKQSDVIKSMAGKSTMLEDSELTNQLLSELQSKKASITSHIPKQPRKFSVSPSLLPTPSLSHRLKLPSKKDLVSLYLK